MGNTERTVREAKFKTYSELIGFTLLKQAFFLREAQKQ
jgi:hypothetical protein